MLSKKFVLDLVERACWTYVQSFLGLLMVSGPLDLDAVRLALVAALPAALAVIKGAGARLVGDKDSAATLL